MKQVTLIVPCYNEEEGLAVFYEETRKVTDTVSGYHFTFLFVDDGSRDGTLTEIRKLQKAHGDVYYLSFSRNFGKEAAMYAGLRSCRGDYCILMDADLQQRVCFFDGKAENC